MRLFTRFPLPNFFSPTAGFPRSRRAGAAAVDTNRNGSSLNFPAARLPWMNRSIHRSCGARRRGEAAFFGNWALCMQFYSTPSTVVNGYRHGSAMYLCVRSSSKVLFSNFSIYVNASHFHLINERACHSLRYTPYHRMGRGLWVIGYG
jgi:hypothetical protein